MAIQNVKILLKNIRRPVASGEAALRQGGTAVIAFRAGVDLIRMGEPPMGDAGNP